MRRVAFFVASVSLAGCALLFDFDTYRPFVQAAPEAEAPPPTPRLALGALAPVRTRRGARTTVPFTLDRTGISGPIVITVTDVGLGVTATGVTLADGEDRGVITLDVHPKTPVGETTAIVHATAGERQDSNALPISIVASSLDPSFGDGGVFLASLWGDMVDLGEDADGGLLIASTRAASWFLYRTNGRQGSVVVIGDEATVDPHVGLRPSGGFDVGLGVSNDAGPAVHSYANAAEVWSRNLGRELSGVVRVIARDDATWVVGNLVVDQRPRALVARLDRAGADGGAVIFPEGPQKLDSTTADALVTAKGIVVCSTDTIEGQAVLALRRFRFDGGLDVGFGTAGVRVIRPTASDDYSCASLAANEERIVIAASAVDREPIGIPRLVFVETDHEGALFTPFGDGGVVDDPALELRPTAVAIDATGDRIYVTGKYSFDRARAVVVAYTRGQRDPGFGDETSGFGVFVLPFNEDATGVVLRASSDGTVLLGGTRDLPQGPTAFLVQIRP